MNKKLLIMSFVFLSLQTLVFAEYPPAGWTDNLIDGIKQAEREGKMLLFDFTGSDWCTWCKKLEAEVWNTPEFEEWSQDNLVKIFIDFPQNISLSEDVVFQNRFLQEYFGVRGYPTVFVFSTDLVPLLKTGYRKGGPTEYIRHIQEDRNLQIDSVAEFQKEFKQLITDNIGPIVSSNPPEQLIPPGD